MAGKGEKGEGERFIRWFSELSNKDVGVAGGKGASLAEMYNLKIPVPPGFIITAQAFEYFLQSTELDRKIFEVLRVLDVNDTAELDRASKKIRDMIEKEELPKSMVEEIVEAYMILDNDLSVQGNMNKIAYDILKLGKEEPFVAVRSSATTEDLADASFAGQQETFLNVKGKKALLKNVKKCMSSLYTPRAIYYREKKGFSHDKSFLSVVVQKMVNSDKSGVIFSRDPTSMDDKIIIEAVWGLGEGIVSGQIKPDHYEIAPEGKNFEILKVNISEKKIAITRDSSGDNKKVKLAPARAKMQVLEKHEIKRLAMYSKQLEKHYRKAQDIEFAIEGTDIYIVQSRPVTTTFKEEEDEGEHGEELLEGLGASPGISSGSVRIIWEMKDLDKIKKGDILVTEMTNPDMVVAMQKAAGIVTDEGGITSHAAIVSREMGIPCVVGTENATKKLKEGEMITVDGGKGRVFKGKGETRLMEVKPILPTRTKIKVILDLPSAAERAALTKAHGIGLVRLEGIIAASGKHPMHFMKGEKIDEYEKIIVKGLKKIVEHFGEAWVRTSDLRSDEFGHLEGAPKHSEGNPMLGDHGIRFSLKHLPILRAELAAVKRVAEEFPHKKLGVMIPQVINVEEVRLTKAYAKEMNVPKNVKIGIMVETPADVQIINNLCEEGIDFISFGTNDLTQYTLAIDRNNEEVQDLFNEMNPAVLNSISYVIRRCKKFGVETSICGQAGSKEEMARFLLKEGIDSISVNADAAHNVSKIVAELEKGDRGKAHEEHMQPVVMVHREHEKDNRAKDMVLMGRMRVPMIQATAEDIDIKPREEYRDLSEEVSRDMKMIKYEDIDKEAKSEHDVLQKDMEEAILEELGDNGNGDYVPGEARDKKKEDIPPLSEPINPSRVKFEPIFNEAELESLSAKSKGQEEGGQAEEAEETQETAENLDNNEREELSEEWNGGDELE